MILRAALVLAQVAQLVQAAPPSSAPASASSSAQVVAPVLSFPEAGLDDTAAYRGYQTRLFRDAAGNTVQIYLDARANRVVHLFADAEDESIGFTARTADGHPAALRWGGGSALVSRAGATRTVEYQLVADAPRISLGWFLLGSMRVERDLQYANVQSAPFADAPYARPELTRLIAAIDALGAVDAAEQRRHLALLHAPGTGALRDRLRAEIARLDAGAIQVVRVRQPAFDGLDTLVMELRMEAARVTSSITADSVVLTARGAGPIAFTVRVSTRGRTLTPLGRREIFTPRFLAFLDAARARASAPKAARADVVAYRRLERQVRGLELLASREKLMAGLPTYATYFGRDMLMTALMMQPVWREEMSEFVVASALRKLSPEGQVSHEEALGGQAMREAASEYAPLIESAIASLRAGDSATAGILTHRARTVLAEARRVRENYHMIDAEFQLPIVVARWLTDPSVPSQRKRAFLLDAHDGGEPRLARLLRELALLARVTAPYANDPVAANLISFAPRDSGRWASQSWRDSNVGYAGGRFAMDVNAIWAPHALESESRILGALRTLGLNPDSVVRADARARGDSASNAALMRYAHDSSALARAIDRWRGASRHFVVRLSAADVRTRVEARLAAMSADEHRYWSAILPRATDGLDSLTFLALSLDANGVPIAVANSDVATRLFLGDREGSRAAPNANERADVLRDVRLFTRRYPVGLLIDGIGPVVANDAYATPTVWSDFDRDRYHSPHVVWGRENNLFLIGTMSRLADAGVNPSDPALAAYARELRDAVSGVLSAVEASGFHSELWSYEVRGGTVVPIRYGSGSDVQLWSTTDMLVPFQWSDVLRGTK